MSTLLSGFTPITTYAAQSNDYVDPADSWLETNNRTNELDANATVTSGTQFCFVRKGHIIHFIPCPRIYPKQAKRR